MWYFLLLISIMPVLLLIWKALLCIYFFLLLKILDKLLDRESQTHKPQTLSSFYSSSKPTVANQKSPSKHAAQSAAAIQQLPGTSVAQQAGVSPAVQSSPETFVEKSSQGKRWYVKVILKPFGHPCKTWTANSHLYWIVVRMIYITTWLLGGY